MSFIYHSSSSLLAGRRHRPFRPHSWHRWNKGLHERLQKERQLQLLIELTHDLLKAESLEEAALVALRILKQLVYFDRASVIAYDLERNEGQLIGVMSENETHLAPGYKFPLSDMGEVEWLKNGRVFNVDDLSARQELSRIDKKMMAEGYRNVILVPIMFGDRLLGSMNMASATPSTFTTQDMEIAGEVANQMALVFQRQRVEADLRESEQRFRYIVKHDPNAIAVLDKEMRYLYVSDRFTHDYRVSGEDIIGRCHYDVFPEMPERWRQVHQRCLRGAIERSEEDIFPRSDGTMDYNRWECRPWHDSKGHIGGIIMYTEVITERKNAQQDLIQQREEYQAIFDSVPSIIAYLDLEDRIVQVNKELSRILARPVSELLGKSAYELFPNDDAEKYSRDSREVRDTGKPKLGIQETMAAADGRQLALLTDKVPYFDRNGKIAGVVLVATDITELKRIEEERIQFQTQIQHAQKLESLGVLAGGIAHDFNNLLVGILGNAGLALMDLPPESPVREYISEVETAARRAADLSRQMLAYSGRGKFVVEPLNLSTLVEEMAHLLEVSITKKADLKCDFEKDIPLVEGDATQLRQVVMNLITNASDALLGHGGFISVRTGAVYVDKEYLAKAGIEEDLPAKRYVFLEVTDNGCGMNEETLKKIFDPFFTTKFVGRGLGLAAVQGIMRGHHGAITVSSAPDCGSTFRIFLPAYEAAPQDASIEAPPLAADTDSFEGQTILIVDDEPGVLILVKRMLSRLGANVLAASDGKQAIEIFNEHSAEISLVLLDLTMPMMDGEETFRRMREIKSDQLILLSSGYNEQEATSRFSGQGLAGFIQKPYLPRQLIEKIKDALSSAAIPIHQEV